MSSSLVTIIRYAEAIAIENPDPSLLTAVHIHLPALHLSIVLRRETFVDQVTSICTIFAVWKNPVTLKYLVCTFYLFNTDFSLRDLFHFLRILTDLTWLIQRALERGAASYFLHTSSADLMWQAVGRKADLKTEVTCFASPCISWRPDILALEVWVLLQLKRNSSELPACTILVSLPGADHDVAGRSIRLFHDLPTLKNPPFLFIRSVTLSGAFF